jgi:hypothetical protein
MGTLFRVKAARIIAALLLAVITARAADGAFESEWKTQVSLIQIGNGDLHQSYEQVIDYLLPRTRTSGSAASTMVLRFRRSGHAEQQLDIAVSRDNNELRISAWLLQLPFELSARLNSSDGARQLASETHVIKKRLLPSPQLQQLITDRLRNGFSTRLHEGIVLHGEMYDFWARLDDSVLEVHQIPGKSRDELTHWMEQMWLAAEKCEPLQNSY